MFHVVLLEPEIPPNTGNVARLCAVTRSTLHLIEPLGFRLDEGQVKRAGMDYWRHLTWHLWQSWSQFLGSVPSEARLWMIESGGKKRYGDVAYRSGDYLVFGRETKGLPPQILEQYGAQWVRIPMFNELSRSLNLAQSVSVVLYEALRQQDFPAEV